MNENKTCTSFSRKRGELKEMARLKFQVLLSLKPIMVHVNFPLLFQANQGEV